MFGLALPMTMFGQFAATTQFYLYGRQHCTRTGWEKAVSNYPQPDDLYTQDLTDKVFIVTGANSGIGFECASHLAKKNATVYMVCRNPDRAEAAKALITDSTSNAQVHVLLGDCALQSGINTIWKAFVDHRKSLTGDDAVKLNGILCNAGGLNSEAAATLTSEGIETTLAAHLLFGTYHLVNLALPTLESTPDSRVVVVSSGGMYNTKFPSWDRASARRGAFDGQFAYSYAKRGQVLLCEEWTKLHPSVKFVSCHPGWVDTPGVDAAYGASKRFLEPLRSLWEGSEGLLWLLTTPADTLRGGEFYLDRAPRVKHLAGPLFSEGSYTKNTPEEVASMMSQLESWSTLPLQEGPLETVLPALRVARINLEQAKTPLTAMEGPFEVTRHMGRWYVQASIPTYFDKGTINNSEDYRWDEQTQQVLVSFKYSTAVSDAGGVVTPGPVQEVLQRGRLVNERGTEWALKIKVMLFYVPVPMRYLVIAVNEEGEGESCNRSSSSSSSGGGSGGGDSSSAEYTSCMIGVPDRSALWIMNRAVTPMSDEVLAAYSLRAALLGYDVSKINRVALVQPVQV